MISVLVKNVGQGDSIIVEWENNNEKHFGIIDCNLYEDRNPILEEIIIKGIKKIDFIILSHLHIDHYSGLGDLLAYCSQNAIYINYFLHTFTSDLLYILNIIYQSQKIQKNTVAFFTNLQDAINKGIIRTIDHVTFSFTPLNLYGQVSLSFLAPSGKDYFTLAHQRAKNQSSVSSSVPDFNIMSTVINISNGKESILFTSDATKSCFKRIINSVAANFFELVQVPHHGSIFNLEPTFWRSVIKKNRCPALFSVGDVKRDKLPNKEVVEFFENEGYFNTSTNYTYGLKEYYSPTSITPIKSKGNFLSPFSNSRTSTTAVPTPGRFIGDKTFNINL